jgi:hypothetical protein
MRIGGQGEELGESIRSLLFAFGLAIFLVYLVMASQFESLLHPFVILFTIPLALVGAVLALLLTRSPVSVVVFIGLILLVGLVVKNAIILIDKVNQLREEGVAKREALVEGARSRLRPIMMTTLCAVFGFLPLALAFGEGAEVRSPMAITVIGGLLVSTLLTLLVIPVVYDLLDRKPDEFYAERGRRARCRNGDRRAGRGRCCRTSTTRWAKARQGLIRMNITELSIRRPVTTIMLFVSMVVIGLIASFRLPLEAEPEATIPFFFVSLPYAGSTPEEVERNLLRPVEEALATMPGIKSMNSRANAEGGFDPGRVQRLEPRHRHRRLRGARAHRRDPRRPAGRFPPLFRAALEHLRPRGDQPAPDQQSRPDHPRRPDRTQHQAAAGAPAGRGPRGSGGRRQAGSAGGAGQGPPDRARVALNELVQQAAGGQLLGVRRQITEAGQRLRVQPRASCWSCSSCATCGRRRGTRLSDIADVA